MINSSIKKDTSPPDYDEVDSYIDNFSLDYDKVDSYYEEDIPDCDYDTIFEFNDSIFTDFVNDTLLYDNHPLEETSFNTTKEKIFLDIKFENYIITVVVDQSNKFLGIEKICENKSFLSKKHKSLIVSGENLDDFYNDDNSDL